MKRWITWWSEGPGAVPVPQWMRLALLGCILFLIDLGGGIWWDGLVVVGVCAALVAIASRWRCATLICLAVSFGVSAGRTVESGVALTDDLTSIGLAAISIALGLAARMPR